ncbi:MAG: hypothetical protein Q9220_000379 [cf. Caloplaca sp. 1 TL-2023]
MATCSHEDICIYPDSDGEDDDESIRAQTDRAFPISIISNGMLKKLKVNFTKAHQDAIKDSRNVTHRPMGFVDLRWQKKGAGRTWPETFWVVDVETPLVLLGATAHPKNVQTPGSSVAPIGVVEQTPGLLEEAKAELERKRQEVNARRAKEKSDQEAQEAEKRKNAKPG